MPKPTSIRYMHAGSKDHKPPRSLADVPADQLGKATMPRWLDKEAKAIWRHLVVAGGSIP
jgi:hypothetical protein